MITIRVELTLEDLYAHDACDEGIEYFEELLALAGTGDRLVIENWTPLHSVWLARDCPFAAWAREEGLIPSIDLRDANLRDADLRDADLRGADLRGADLLGADLLGADLEGADLEGADLEGANLRGADLEGADLRGADLRYADLRYADLEGANLGAWERGEDGYARRKATP